MTTELSLFHITTAAAVRPSYDYYFENIAEFYWAAAGPLYEVMEQWSRRNMNIIKLGGVMCIPFLPMKYQSFKAIPCIMSKYNVSNYYKNALHVFL